MHIGGVHIIYGLFFLCVTILLTTTYVYIGYLFFVTCRKLFYRYRKTVALNKYISGQGPSPEEAVKRPNLKYWNRSFLIKALVLVCVFESVMYFHQRISWMGDENKYYEAKEYWVAGQVVYAHRMISERILHPGNPVNVPYMLLQKLIFAKGQKYLPANDGERYVWQNSWFFYLYTRKGVRPYGIGDKEYEPEMAKFLDSCWAAMNGLMTLEIADRKMKRKALFGYPFLSSYYSLYQGHYTGPYWLSGYRTRNDKKFIKRNYQMLEWEDDLYNQWRQNGYLREIFDKYPYVASFRQYNVNRLLQNLALSIANSTDFSCNHPILLRLYEEYRISMSTDPKVNSFLNLKKKNSKQATLTYQMAVYHPLGQAGNYLLSHICKKKMPKEQYLMVDRRGIYNAFYKPDRVEHIYKKELKQFINKVK